MKFPTWRMKVADHKCEIVNESAKTSQTSVDEDEEQRPGFFLSLILISCSNQTARNVFRSTYARYAEKERQSMSKYWYMVHPFSKLRMLWQLFMVFVLFGSLFMIPYSHSFYMVGLHEKEDIDMKWFLLHILHIFDLLCFADIVMNFFTGYYDYNAKETVLDQLLVIRKYVKCWLWIDLISSIPFDYIFERHLNADELGYDTAAAGVGFLLASIKIIRMWTLLDHIAKLSKAYGLHAFAHRLIQIAVVSFMLLHWTACLSYLIPFAYNGRDLTNVDAPDFVTKFQYSWINRYRLYHLTMLRKYRFTMVRAAAQMAFIGTCNSDRVVAIEDQLEAIRRLIIAIIFNAYLFANIYYMTMSYYKPDCKYYEIINEVTHFMFHNQLPRRVIGRIASLYEYRFQKRYSRDHLIFKSLSVPIRLEVMMFCSRGLVERLEIFQNLPRPIIVQVVMALQSVIFLEGDVIVQAGTVGECMYFLACGSVAVMLPSGREACHLTDGNHFGEVSLITADKIRTATIVALETTQCFQLNRADFQHCVAGQPLLMEAVQRVAFERQRSARTKDKAFYED